jgi:hypothetical protein
MFLQYLKMPKTANKNDALKMASKELFIYVALLFTLLLTLINISTYLRPKKVKVLAAETQNKSTDFWEVFLDKNPSYVPGWIETGKLDKAMEIDPNYTRP